MNGLLALLQRLKSSEFRGFMAETRAIGVCAKAVNGQWVNTSRPTLESKNLREAINAYTRKRDGLLIAKLEKSHRLICAACKMSFPEKEMVTLVTYDWHRSTPRRNASYSSCVFRRRCRDCAAQLIKESGPGTQSYCYPAKKEPKPQGGEQIMIKQFGEWRQFSPGTSVEDETESGRTADAVELLGHLEFVNHARSLKLATPPQIVYMASDECHPRVIVLKPADSGWEECKNLITETFQLG